MKKALCALLLVGTLSLAEAHYLWIEGVEPGKAVVRFGHYEEGVREASPGFLDKIPVPVAGADKAKAKAKAKASPLPDGFALSYSGKAATVWAAVENAAVFDNSAKQKPSVRMLGYARWIADRTAKVAPGMTLDIVPAGGDRNRFLVVFQGKPLPQAEVEVHAPNQWSRTWKTDDQGLVTVDTPFPGAYVLEVSHKDPTKGAFQDVPYDTASYVATLSFDGP